MTQKAIEWAASLDEALARAGRERRFVLADFSKENCAGCEALEERTFPDPAVAAFLVEHFIPVKLLLGRKAHQPHFQAYRVLWTPTIVLLDRRAAAQYEAPGYLPAPLFLQMLRIGLGRALLAWSRHDEAAGHLSSVAEDRDSPLAPEALFWLGAAFYLRTRRRAELMKAWGKLLREHPGSIWAARVPPGEDAAEADGGKVEKG